MDHPSETFLTTIEEDLMKLIIKYGMTVSKELGIMYTEKSLKIPAVLIFFFNPTLNEANSASQNNLASFLYFLSLTEQAELSVINNSCLG